MSDIPGILRSLAESLSRTADLLERAEELAETSPLTLAETASALRVDERTVRRHIADGKLVAFKVGPAWRIPRTALAEFTGRAS